MASFGVKFGKVWKVKKENGFTKIDVSDSRKNPKSPTGFDNCTWFNCILLGNAKDFDVKEGDKVNVEGQIFTTKSEKDGKYYTNVVIFGICLSDDAKTNAPKNPNKVKMQDVKVDLPKKEETPDINFDDDDEFPFNLASGTSKTKNYTKFIETNPNPYYDNYDVDFDCND